MTVPRIFIKKENISEDTVTATGDACHKISHVLRSRKGDRIIFFDGNGIEYETVAESFSKDKCFCRVIKEISHSEKEKTGITLLLGILKKENMESAIDKASQLGVSVIVPLKCERSQVRINDSKQKDKQSRWKKIAIESCALSRRLFIPEITMPATVNNALKCSNEADLKIILCENEKSHIKYFFEKNKKGVKGKSIAVAIGPEGGFTEGEIKEFQSAEFESVSLGDHILSADTAVATALSIIGYETDGFR